MSPNIESVRHRSKASEGPLDDGRLEILLVEARDTIARVVASVLETTSRGRFEITRDRSLFGALNRADLPHYDLILVDLSLPDSDRIATIELASELAHRFPVVMLTGTETPNDMRPGGIGSNGVDDDREAVARSVYRADLPSKLLAAVRRHRRLGPEPEGPRFCRIGYAGGVC